jgi:DUF4097 and DUF4098 domain-containing protein YvlB
VRREAFQTPGPLALDIRLPAGRAQIETSETTETVVALEPLRGNEASEQAVADARVELRDRPAGGQELAIAIDERRSFGFWRGAEVRVRVRCPHGTSVEGHGGSADFEGQGRYGALRISTASGDVEFAQIEREANVNSASGDVALGIVGRETEISTASGDVAIVDAGGRTEINSASGDVRVEKVRGALTAHTASGDVLVREAESSVTVKSASGDQRVDSAVSGEVKLQSASGDIHVGVRSGTKVWMDVHSRSGEARSDLDVGDVPPPEGGPELSVRASSMSGDIEIVRA